MDKEIRKSEHGAALVGSIGFLVICLIIGSFCFSLIQMLKFKQSMDDAMSAAAYSLNTSCIYLPLGTALTSCLEEIRTNMEAGFQLIGRDIELRLSFYARPASGAPFQLFNASNGPTSRFVPQTINTTATTTVSSLSSQLDALFVVEVFGTHTAPALYVFGDGVEFYESSII